MTVIPDAYSKPEMRLAQRYSEVVAWFRDNMPAAESELHFRSAYELITAVILSAQCTDKRVNMVTPALFSKYPDIHNLALAEAEEVLPIIKSVSYPNSKAVHLCGMARKVVSDFGGEIPDSIDSLMTLPGVGRKTANVVASIIYNKPVIAVDTHVFRVSHRIGLSKGRTPQAVELDLEKHIPVELRAVAHHWLILHGRYVCKSQKPQCKDCGLRNCCLYFSKNSSPDRESIIVSGRTEP